MVSVKVNSSAWVPIVTRSEFKPSSQEQSLLRSHGLQVDRVRSRGDEQPLRDKTESLMGDGNN